MTVVSVSEARASLAEILQRVEAGEEVTITRHDKPVAVVLAPQHVRARRAAVAEIAARADELHRDLEAARHEPLPARGTLSRELGEQWLRELRTERDAG